MPGWRRYPTPARWDYEEEEKRDRDWPNQRANSVRGRSASPGARQEEGHGRSRSTDRWNGRYGRERARTPARPAEAMGARIRVTNFPYIYRPGGRPGNPRDVARAETARNLESTILAHGVLIGNDTVFIREPSHVYTVYTGEAYANLAYGMPAAGVQGALAAIRMIKMPKDDPGDDEGRLCVELSRKPLPPLVQEQPVREEWAEGPPSPARHRGREREHTPARYERSPSAERNARAGVGSAVARRRWSDDDLRDYQDNQAAIREAVNRKEGRLPQRTGEGEQRTRSPAPHIRLKVAIQREGESGLFEHEEYIDLEERARYEEEAMGEGVEFVMPVFCRDDLCQPGRVAQTVVAPILRPPHAGGAPWEAAEAGRRVSWDDQFEAQPLGTSDPSPGQAGRLLPPVSQHVNFQTALEPVGTKVQAQALLATGNMAVAAGKLRDGREEIRVYKGSRTSNLCVGPPNRARPTSEAVLKCVVVESEARATWTREVATVKIWMLDFDTTKGWGGLAAHAMRCFEGHLVGQGYLNVQTGSLVSFVGEPRPHIPNDTSLLNAWVMGRRESGHPPYCTGKCFGWLPVVAFLDDHTLIQLVRQVRKYGNPPRPAATGPIKQTVQREHGSAGTGESSEHCGGGAASSINEERAECAVEILSCQGCAQEYIMFLLPNAVLQPVVCPRCQVALMRPGPGAERWERKVKPAEMNVPLFIRDESWVLMESGAVNPVVLENQAGTCEADVAEVHATFCRILMKYLPQHHAEERPWGFASLMVLDLLHRVPANRRDMMVCQVKAWEARGPGKGEDPHAAFDRLLYALLQRGFEGHITRDTIAKLGQMTRAILYSGYLIHYGERRVVQRVQVQPGGHVGGERDAQQEGQREKELAPKANRKEEAQQAEWVTVGEAAGPVGDILEWGGVIRGTSLEDFHPWDAVECKLCRVRLRWEDWPKHEDEVGHQVERLRAGKWADHPATRIWEYHPGNLKDQPKLSGQAYQTKDEERIEAERFGEAGVPSWTLPENPVVTEMAAGARSDSLEEAQMQAAMLASVAEGAAGMAQGAEEQMAGGGQEVAAGGDGVQRDPVPQWQIQAVEQSRWVLEVESRQQRGLRVSKEDAELARAVRIALGDRRQEEVDEQREWRRREEDQREEVKGNMEELDREEHNKDPKEPQKEGRDRREADQTLDGEEVNEDEEGWAYYVNETEEKSNKGRPATPKIRSEPAEGCLSGIACRGFHRGRRCPCADCSNGKELKQEERGKTGDQGINRRAAEARDELEDGRPGMSGEAKRSTIKVEILEIREGQIATCEICGEVYKWPNPIPAYHCSKKMEVQTMYITESIPAEAGAEVVEPNQVGIVEKVAREAMRERKAQRQERMERCAMAAIPEADEEHERDHHEDASEGGIWKRLEAHHPAARTLAFIPSPDGFLGMMEGYTYGYGPELDSNGGKVEGYKRELTEAAISQLGGGDLTEDPSVEREGTESEASWAAVSTGSTQSDKSWCAVTGSLGQVRSRPEMPEDAAGFAREIIEKQQRDYDLDEINRCSIVLSRYLQDAEAAGRGHEEGWITLDEARTVMRRQQKAGLPTDQTEKLDALIRGTVQLRQAPGTPMFEWQEGGPSQSARTRAYRHPGDTVSARARREEEQKARKSGRRGGAWSGASASP